MIKFLIESSICLTILYGVYWFFLRKEKFLGLNRYYLIGAALISILIPLLEFSYSATWTTPVQAVTYIFPSTIENGAEVIESPNAFRLFTISNIYLMGVVITGFLLVLRFYTTLRRSGLKLSLKRRGVQVVSAEGYQAFSFLNTIVLGQEIGRNPELKKTIMLHEMAHVQGRHSIDLLLMEILKCLYWFNPFIYLAIRSLKIQHEYIADAHVLKQVSLNVYERSLATLTLAKIDQSLVHAFGKLPLERRIKMIYNTNSNVMNKLKLLIVLPIVGLLLFQFSCTEDAFLPDEEVEMVDQGMFARVEKTVHGMNIKSDGETTVNKERFRLHGVVKDAEGSVLSGVKVSTSDSGEETITKNDGTFSLMVTSNDKALLLNHSEKRTTRVDLEKTFAPPTIGTVEIPDGLHLDQSAIEKKVSFLSKKLVEENEALRLDASKKKPHTIQEIEFEEQKVASHKKQEIAKKGSILEKRKN